jgi:hypothetical protein
MVFNATFNNISVISWQSVLLVEETGENHRPVASHWQTTIRSRPRRPLTIMVDSITNNNNMNNSGDKPQYTVLKQQRFCLSLIDNFLCLSHVLCKSLLSSCVKQFHQYKKETSNSLLKSLNTKKSMTYVDSNLGQAQQYGSVKLVEWIPNLLSW